MGAYQLFYLDRVPDMAAVDESVSLTRVMGLEALTGLVNGVLRNMIRGKNDVVWPKPQDDAVKYLSIMFSAPEEDSVGCWSRRMASMMRWRFCVTARRTAR